MRFFFNFLFLILFSTVVFAHLDAGEDKVVDGFLVDFGYAPLEPFAGQKTVFAINLVNDGTKEVIDFDKLWVRFSLAEESVFAANFRPENSNVAFTFTFPKKGNYDIDLKFFNNDNALVQTDFNLDAKEEFKNSQFIALALILTILVLVFRSLFKPKSTHKKK